MRSLGMFYALSSCDGAIKNSFVAGITRGVKPDYLQVSQRKHED